MQQRGAAQVAQQPLVGRRAPRPRSVDDHAGAVRVPVGPRRLRVDDARERVGDPVEPRVVGEQQPVRGLPRRDVVVVERRPRTPRRRGTSPNASTSAGSNQRPARLRSHAPRPRGRRPRRGRSRPSGRGRGCAPSSGISSPRSPRGWPPPSQCSSSARIASAVSALKPSMSAISAPRSQRAAISARVTSPSVLDRAAAGRRASAASRPARRSAATTRTPGSRADQSTRLERPLRDVVVGAEQRGHPRRVRRAAGVLEQQRVEEVRARRGVELERLREPHADLARPLRVARRLALGEVERERQRADHPGEWDLLRFRAHARSIACPPSPAAPFRVILHHMVQYSGRSERTPRADDARAALRAGDRRVARGGLRRLHRRARAARVLRPRRAGLERRDGVRPARRRRLGGHVRHARRHVRAPARVQRRRASAPAGLRHHGDRARTVRRSTSTSRSRSRRATAAA